VKLPSFSYACPESLDEAMQLLAEGGAEARPLAGGQSLLAMMALRLVTPALLIDLQKIASLHGISITPDGVRLGATVRWRDIEDHRPLASAFPLLKAAIGHVAHYQVRNKGTIGGSLAQADPAAEFPGIAVTCEAMIEVANSKGKREIPAAALFTGPLQTCLEGDELIIAVRFPPWRDERRWAFEEFSRRPGDFALAAVAVWYDLGDSNVVENAHIGLIGATAVPRRIAAAEAAINGYRLDAGSIAAAADAASKAAQPNDDPNGSAAYRRSLVGTLLSRALRRTLVKPQ
jgi:aerobic carbon-monoxide dehydrogenase medium subunit